GGRLYCRPARGTPGARSAVSGDRGLDSSGLLVSSVPRSPDCAVSGDGLSGDGKWCDLSGGAPTLQPGDRDHLRARRRGRRYWGISRTVGARPLQRPQRYLCDRLRHVRRGLRADYASGRDVLAAWSPEHGSAHLTLTARISIVDKAFPRNTA